MPDDVDAGIFLQLDREQRGVAFGAGESGAFRLPRRPERVGFGQPFGFRQRTGVGGDANGLPRFGTRPTCISVTTVYP